MIVNVVNEMGSIEYSVESKLDSCVCLEERLVSFWIDD